MTVFEVVSQSGARGASIYDVARTLGIQPQMARKKLDIYERQKMVVREKTLGRGRKGQLCFGVVVYRSADLNERTV